MRHMTTLTGPAADIARAHATLSALHTLTVDALARVAALAADDPDAAEAGKLVSASHGVQLAVLTLDGVLGDLADATHTAHASRGQ